MHVVVPRTGVSYLCRVSTVNKIENVFPTYICFAIPCTFYAKLNSFHQKFEKSNKMQLFITLCTCFGLFLVNNPEN